MTENCFFVTKNLPKLVREVGGGNAMADVGTRRQREQDQSTSQSTGLTPSERTEGRTKQSQGSQGQGMERYQQGRYTPSVFSVSPGEFFTLSPITLMRRFAEDIDRAFGLSSGRSRSGG